MYAYNLPSSPIGEETASLFSLILLGNPNSTVCAHALPVLADGDCDRKECFGENEEATDLVVLTLSFPDIFTGPFVGLVV